MAKKRKKTAVSRRPNRRWRWLAVGIAVLLAGVALFSIRYESFASLYDAEYVGSETCGECHAPTYEAWDRSPHANMTRRPTAASVVGNFQDYEWALPTAARISATDTLPAARMYQQGGDYYMALRQPDSTEFVPFKVEYVIGYQYRQVYLTREPGGVLRRLPLQWSTELQDYFPYWNFQEQSTPYLHDLWAQRRQ